MNGTPFAQMYLNAQWKSPFVLSRALNRFAGGSDVLWEKERDRSI